MNQAQEPAEPAEPETYDTDLLKRIGRSRHNVTAIVHITARFDHLSEEQFQELRSHLQIIERLGNAEVAT